MCTPVCLHVCLCRHQNRASDLAGTGVTDHCELSCGCWEWNPAPLQEQPVLLSLIYSSRPIHLIYRDKVSHWSWSSRLTGQWAPCICSSLPFYEVGVTGRSYHTCLGLGLLLCIDCSMHHFTTYLSNLVELSPPKKLDPLNTNAKPHISLDAMNPRLLHCFLLIPAFAFLPAQAEPSPSTHPTSYCSDSADNR